MKAAVIFMGSMVAILVVLVYRKSPDALLVGIRLGGTQLLGFLPVMALAFVMIGLSEQLLDKNAIQHWMSDASGWRGIAVAWLAGILTPGGPMFGPPLAGSLFAAGAGAGVVVTYLTSISLLSLLRLPMELGFYSGRLLALRVGATLILPPIAGLIARGLSRFL